jgi:hypothetical protein
MVKIFFVDKINLIMYVSQNATNSSSLPWYDLVSKKNLHAILHLCPPKDSVQGPPLVVREFGDALPDVGMGDRESDFDFMSVCKVCSSAQPLHIRLT